MNSRAVSTRGSMTSCSEREVAGLRHLVRTFLNMSKESNLDSFDTELFITETGRCRPFGISYLVLTAIKKMRWKQCAKEIYWKLFYFYHFPFATLQA